MHKQGSPSNFTWNILLTIGFVGFVPFYALMISAASLPTMQVALGFSPRAVAAYFGIGFCGLAIGYAAAGVLSDILGRRRVMLWGLAIFVISSAAVAFSVDAMTMLASRFFQLAGGGGAVVVLAPLIRDISRGLGERVKRGNFVVIVATSLGPIIGIPSGAVIEEFSHWRVGLLLPLVIGGGAFMMAYFNVRDNVSPPSGAQMSRIRHFPALNVMLSAAVGACSLAVANSFVATAPFVFRAHHLSPLMYSAFGVVGPIIVIIGADIYRRIPRSLDSSLVICASLVQLLPCAILFTLSTLDRLEIEYFVLISFASSWANGILISYSVSSALEGVGPQQGAAGSMLGASHLFGSAVGAWLPFFADSQVSELVPLGAAAIAALNTANVMFLRSRLSRN